MDQRTDNERRQDIESGREAKSAIGRVQTTQSWVDSVRGRRDLVLTITALIIVALVALVVWWFNATRYETTDDAFIDARTVPISSQVNAAVVDVPVTDNQLVEAGAALVRLDDRDYKAQADQAKAQVDQSKANIANIDAQLVAQQARINQADKQATQSQAALTFAQQEDERYQRLVKTGAVTVEQAQQYTSNLLQAQAAFAAAQSNEIATEKQLPVLQSQRQLAEAQLEQARAAREQAEANLSRTVITAPVAGRVARLTVTKGTYAAVGQALMMFVPREVWVTANFKETQLKAMRPGDPVDIKIDTYPQRTFKGHVDSIQAGSGTAFSLLPAENATGNFVKIVQRVPVKIVFDEPPDVLLGPGMSVVPSVKIK
jgi:membrane fusion protein, multidrug efflux system